MRIVLVLMAMVFTLHANDSVMKNLIDHVLIKNVQLALGYSKKLSEQVGKKNVNVEKAREEFQNLVYAWKKVEATYIGGELDSDYLDTPRFIDIYHEGNENIHKQLARIRKSKDSLDIELFKNSHKTINALEYVLYSANKLTKRDVDMVNRINSNIHKRLTEILNVYKNNSQKLIKDEVFANGAVLNALISSSYKNAMWRVAEGQGKGKKYKKADKKRFEYSLSQTSVKAIKAIVEAHSEVMDGDYRNFGDMAFKNGAKEEVKRVRVLLKESKDLLSSMNDKDLIGKKGDDLYRKLKELYINYGLYMIDALSITAKIIDADGD